MKGMDKRGRELEGRLFLYCLPIVHRVLACFIFFVLLFLIIVFYVPYW